jgi:sugar phosphate isomerase/epimerase
MKLSQVALQLYTVRDFCHDEASLAQTLKKVRAIGYEAVQVSGVGPIPPARVARLCADEGLIICATHEDSALLRQDPLAAVARLQEYGTTLTAYPYPRDVDFADPHSVDSLLADLRHTGEVFQENGCQLSYHNHAIEFLQVGGRTIMDRLLQEVPAGILGFELDTYWVQYGGGNPEAWCRKAAGRLPAIHLKDYQFLASDQPAFAEIGKGNLDFPAIVAAAGASGCRWFIVEQDTCPGDPFASAAISFACCRDSLCS